jgi:hypothetical protein
LNLLHAVRGKLLIFIEIGGFRRLKSAYSPSSSLLVSYPPWLNLSFTSAKLEAASNFVNLMTKVWAGPKCPCERCFAQRLCSTEFCGAQDEDRGMMQLVEVLDNETVVKHH